MIFALLTVIVTVHSYVFYSLYVVNGGVMMFGKLFPIWAVVVLEFVLAYTLECVMGRPCSFKLACKVFDPKTTHPVLFETAIICATVGLMCPAMSFYSAADSYLV